ncbi:MAG: hypothetical protein Ta2G_13180 [Termitinemataceae bacterium]|nr:MAG: hypothetical protein Ta2G_13180 [Termitinemataceae bacterium]
MFVPYLIFYNFPSLSARSGEQYDLNYHLSFYFVNDSRFKTNNPIPRDSGRTYDTENVDRDYESTIGEAGVSFNPTANLQLGMDMRVMGYYGGIADAAIEKFHGIFGFPNGLRDYFLQNQVYVNIKNEQGLSLFLNKPITSFGDIDLWAKWTFFETKLISLAGLGAFKIPSGKLNALSGSGYPDFGFGAFLDLRAARYLTIYVQAGGVFPFYLKPNPMFNGLLGLEFNRWKYISINAQVNIKSPPITNDYYWKPQTNILVGFIAELKDFKLQFYFEEDMITNQGTDLTLNITLSHKLHLAKYKKSSYKNKDEVLSP